MTAHCSPAPEPVSPTAPCPTATSPTPSSRRVAPSTPAFESDSALTLRADPKHRCSPSANTPSPRHKCSKQASTPPGALIAGWPTLESMPSRPSISQLAVGPICWVSTQDYSLPAGSSMPSRLTSVHGAGFDAGTATIGCRRLRRLFAAQPRARSVTYGLVGDWLNPHLHELDEVEPHPADGTGLADANSISNR